jgi:hypothetical protein
MNLKTVSPASHEIDSTVVQVPVEPIIVDEAFSSTRVRSEASLARLAAQVEAPRYDPVAISAQYQNAPLKGLGANLKYYITVVLLCLRVVVGSHLGSK